jgi:hypothetical protein
MKTTGVRPLAFAASISPVSRSVIPAIKCLPVEVSRSRYRADPIRRLPATSAERATHFGNGFPSRCGDWCRYGDLNCRSASSRDHHAKR